MEDVIIKEGSKYGWYGDRVAMVENQMCMNFLAAKAITLNVC